jgi:hypothetical protein
MRRRKFLKSIAWLTGGILLSRCTPARLLLPDGKSLTGTVSSNGKGLKEVVVSDGYSVVATSKNGQFAFVPHPDAVCIFISTPSGFAFENTEGIARHYRLLQDVDLQKSINFDLVPLAIDDNEHQFIIWADPQVANAKDVEKLMQQSVPDVQKLVANSGSGALMHGIAIGDIVWDKLEMFRDHDLAVKKMGIPFFQCLGNHDMDYRKGGDETSDDTFQQTYGPTYYSFNRGEVHYVVMDNVRYLGTERDYDGYVQQHQLDWLKKDLEFVPANKLLVLCVHIPVHRLTNNSEALYALLKNRNVHIMSGHTHFNVNVLNGNIYEHNHGTVCGAWWTGPVCNDGTPSGYGVYKVKGTSLQWHYQSTGKEAEYQMKLYVKEFNHSEKQLIANIWNYDPAWKNEYFVDGVSKGPLEQFEGFDPLAYELMLGPNLPKPRGFAEPQLTSHLFRTVIPAGAKEIEVVATDRFGNVFRAKEKI